MDSKNVIAAISLSAAVIILYSLFWAPPPPDPKLLQTEKNKVIQNDSTEAPSLDQNNEVVKISREEALEESKRILFENENIKGSISLTGSKIDDLEFKKFKKTLNGNDNVTLLNPRKVKNGYYVETGWATTNKNINVPNTKSLWKIEGNSKLTPSSPIILSWINDFIPQWILIWQRYGYKINWLHDVSRLPEGDICFFLGCSEIVNNKSRCQHKHNMVVHESDLPKGRGWSPLTWQILEGSQKVIVSLIEAAELVDAGDIYSQTEIELRGNELVEELRNKQASATFKLCDDFIIGLPCTAEKKRMQIGSPSYYNRRTPKDSELNANIPLADQFDLLRVCDNERYPAWFRHKGRKFVLRIDQSEDEGNAN